MTTSQRIKSGIALVVFCSSFLLNAQISVTYLIVGGGGGGGGGNDRTGGGGSGGRVQSGTTSINSGTNYTVTVGSGGRGGSGIYTSPADGENSSFNSITSVGGGYGGWREDNGTLTQSST